MDLTQLIVIMATMLTMFGICFKHIANGEIHVSSKDSYVSSDTCDKTNRTLLLLIDTRLKSFETQLKANQEDMKVILELVKSK